MSLVGVTEHSVRIEDHAVFHLAAGPVDGPLLVFVHGWPELSRSWRHQLPVFGALGFRAIAPDLRGYGRSTNYHELDDYTQEKIVGDLIGLLDALGREQAVFVGHDWGSPVVWNIASHHPDRCRAVASLCVPYWTLEQGWDALVSLVDRNVYPQEQYPVGQWDYQLYYQENFDRSTEVMGVSSYDTVKALFRKGNPKGLGQPAITASVRAAGGWFGGLDAAPDIPMDPDVVTEEDLRAYAESLDRNSFFGPNAFYMNHEANEEYGKRAVNDGHLDMPVLFLAARYDYTCESVESDLAKPMADKCSDLRVETFDCGHWMAQEKPVEVNSALTRWLVERVPDVWPT